MISDQDRSGWIGASDTDKVIGNWKTDTWMKWWMQKIGINTDRFDNKYTLAGTHFEHRILESLGIPMELDKQVILEDIRLRVNLDGNTPSHIYECKTFQQAKGFKLPKKYINQVQVQMYATGIHEASIVAYGLEEADYSNYLREIDPQRRLLFDIPYDGAWVESKYLPRLHILAKCLKEGSVPDEAAI